MEALKRFAYAVGVTAAALVLIAVLLLTGYRVGQWECRVVEPSHPTPTET